MTPVYTISQIKNKNLVTENATYTVPISTTQINEDINDILNKTDCHECSNVETTKTFTKITTTVMNTQKLTK